MSLYDDRAQTADAIAGRGTLRRSIPPKDEHAERERQLRCKIRYTAPQGVRPAAALVIRERHDWQPEARSVVPGYTGTSMPTGQGPGAAASIRHDRFAIRESIAATHRAERHAIAAQVAAGKAAEAQQELIAATAYRQALAFLGIARHLADREIADGFATRQDYIRRAMRRTESDRYRSPVAALGVEICKD